MPRITIDEKENYAIMNLDGNFNSEDDSEKLRESFKGVAKKNINRVLVNLKNVLYLNSACLGSLLSGNSIIKKINGKVVLYDTNDYLNNIFSITKIDMTIPIEKDFESALSRLDQEEEETYL